MASLGQKHGGCGHLMAGFDTHSFCARCRDKRKSPDPCIYKSDCQACSVLSEDQQIQLSIPSYRLRKEKQEFKKLSDTPQKDSNSSSLIDLSAVMVVGAVEDQGMLQSLGLSSSFDKKKKKANSSDKPKSHKSSSERPSKSVDSKPTRSSADARIDELDQKWSDLFNRLEALHLSRTPYKPEHTFQAPRVTPTHPPLVGAVKASCPLTGRTTDRPARSDLSGTDHTTPQGQVTNKSPTVVKQKHSTTSDLPGTDHTTSRRQSTSKLSRDKPTINRPSELSGTDSPAIHPVSSSEADGLTQRYKDPPTPRRLVGESQIPPNLPPAYPRTSPDMSELTLVSEFG